MERCRKISVPKNWRFGVFFILWTVDVAAELASPETRGELFPRFLATEKALLYAFTGAKQTVHAHPTDFADQAQKIILVA